MKIPGRLLQFFSFAVVILLLGSLALLVREVQKPQFTAPRADVGETPKDIRLTNLTENSVTVSWITDEEVAGIVKYGTDPTQLIQTATEDDGRVPAQVHHITLKPLKPRTDYYFRLQSGQSIFDDSGKPFTVATPKVISTPPPPAAVYGSVTGTGEAGLSDKAIVYLDVPNSSTPLSTLVNENSGNWSVSISTVRAGGGDHYLAVADDTILKIFVQGGSQGNSTATVKLSQSNPVPSIGLGRTYSFDKLTAKTEPKTASEEVPAAGEFTVGPNLTPTEVNLAVTNIAEGETLTDPSPTFTGTAPPAVKIKITVQSPTVYTADITVKPDGTWNWTPPADLAPGPHTITITYTDETGQTHTESKTFLVQSASNTLNTPSSPISSPSPIPTVAEQQLPAAGSAFPTIVIFSLGLVSTFLGIKYSLQKS